MADREDFATAVGALIKDVRWYQGGLNTSFPVNDPLGALADGDYRVTGDSTAAALGLPGGAGNLKQVSYGTFGMHLYTSQFGGVATRIWQDSVSAWGSWVNPHETYTDQVAEQITWYHGGLAADAPVNAPLGGMKDGDYRISTDARAVTDLGITGGAAGRFTQISYGTFGIQINTHLTGTVARLWSDGSQAWGSWVPHGTSTPAPTPVDGGAASGMKVVPLALTLGHGGGANPSTSGTVRIPMHWGAPVVRWRLHVRNINPREGIRDLFTGPVGFPQGLWLGEDLGDGAAGTLTQVHAAFSTPDNGDEYVSGWITHELPADSQHLLSFAYEATDQVVRNAGGMWTSVGHVADSTTATWTKELMGPLDLWIEAETPAGTPVVAVIGDSLSVGSASTLPVHDSTLSQHMRAWGGLPIHYAHVGDTLHSWNGYGDNFSEDYKKGRWLHLAQPDSVLFALGSNDIFGYSQATVPTMQGRFEQTLGWVREALSENVFFSTITPRTADTTVQEQVRRDYNAWMKTRTDTRQVFDFAAAISTDDETIIPEYDGDGVHLTTAGYAAEAAILRYLTAPAPLYRTV